MEYLDLFKIEDFKIIKKDVGEIKWLEPLDIRYLKLEEII